MNICIDKTVLKLLNRTFHCSSEFVNAKYVFFSSCAQWIFRCICLCLNFPTLSPIGTNTNQTPFASNRFLLFRHKERQRRKKKLRGNHIIEPRKKNRDWDTRAFALSAYRDALHSISHLLDEIFFLSLLVRGIFSSNKSVNPKLKDKIEK